MSTAAVTTEIRYRLQGSNGVWTYHRFPVAHLIEVPGLDRGQTYEIQARNLSALGTPSAWIAVTHVVDDASEIPQAPISLTAIKTVSGVKLDWQLAPGVTLPSGDYFAVDYSPDAGGAPSGVWTTAYTTTKGLTMYLTFNDTVVRWFRVYAVTQAGIPSTYTNLVNSNGLDLFGHGVNLLYNPTGSSGFAGWPNWIGGSQLNMTTVVENEGPAFACTTSPTSMDQGVQQIVKGRFDSLTFTLSGYMYAGHMTSGTTIVQLRFLNASGAEINSGNRPAISANSNDAAQFYQVTGVAGSGCAQIAVIIRSTGTGTGGLTRWYKLKLEVGSTATPFDSVFSTGDQLTNAGSGQSIGNQFNLLPINWMGVRSMLNTTPISFSYNTASPATVTFSCTAVTVTGGSASLSYNASSTTKTQTRGTTQTWYFYYIDPPPSTGGTKTLQATTNPNDLSSQDGIVNLGNGSVTVPSTASGGSGSGAGGGGGWCVGAEMWIRKGLLAGDAKPGDIFDCMDLPTKEGVHERALWNVTHVINERIRLITNKGAAWIGGVETPFDLPDGRQVTAMQMLGEKVMTDKGEQTIISAALIGPGRLCRFNLGGVSYAAGGDPCNRIYSHNVTGTGVEKP